MRVVVAIACCLAVFACAPAGQVTGLDARLAAAERRLEALESETRNTSEAVWSLTAETQGPALVDFSSQNFSVGHSDYGAYLISPVRIDEAGAGYRVRFHVINATSLTLTDARVQVSWIDDGAKSVSETVAGNFAPGTARAVTVTLAEATPAALRRMNVGVSFQGARFVLPQ